jgi:branched-chain amino acid transport system permease protein
MARAVGIHPQLAYVVVFAIGSALAAVAMLLFAMRGATVATSGLTPSFTALAVAYLAGTRSSPLRFAAAGVLVGVLQALANLYISGTWGSVVTFGILFIYVSAAPYLQGRKRLIRLGARGADAARQK